VKISTRTLQSGVSFLVCLVVLTLLQSQQLDKLLRQPDTPQKDIFATESEAVLLKTLPNLGFGNLLADWTFLRFLQYFGEEESRLATGYNLSPIFFEGILANDPRLSDFYLFLHNSTSLYAGQPETAIAISEAAIVNLAPNQPPDAFYPWRYKATDQLLFLGDGEAAQRSFEIAADWAEQSSLPEGYEMSILSAETANFLADNPRSRSAQISAWAGILGNPIDDTTRQLAIEQIIELGGEIRPTEDGRFSISYPQED